MGAVFELDFEVPPGCNFKGAPARIEAACRACGLRVSTRATLASCPGSIHWHIKRGIQPGTLELTLWEAKRRIWARVEDHRRAPWIEQDLPAVREAVEAALRSAVS